MLFDEVVSDHSMNSVEFRDSSASLQSCELFGDWNVVARKEHIRGPGRNNSSNGMVSRHFRDSPPPLPPLSLPFLPFATHNDSMEGKFAQSYQSAGTYAFGQ